MTMSLTRESYSCFSIIAYASQPRAMVLSLQLSATVATHNIHITGARVYKASGQFSDFNIQRYDIKQ